MKEFIMNLVKNSYKIYRGGVVFGWNFKILVVDSPPSGCTGVGF